MLGIIIPTYGQFDYAVRAVESALTQSDRPGLESIVLVMDDASPDWNPQVFATPTISAKPGKVILYQFEQNGGITRSWEKGFELARAEGCDKVLFGNSDILFAENSLTTMSDAIDRTGAAIVGPLSNGPGKTTPFQAVYNWMPHYKPDDSQIAIDYTESWLKENVPGSSEFLLSSVNGFCMMADVQKMAEVAEHRGSVFSPAHAHRMVFSEDELQKVTSSMGMQSRLSTRSFVFHYRSVTRGDAYKHGKWFRSEK